MLFCYVLRGIQRANSKRNGESCEWNRSKILLRCFLTHYLRPSWMWKRCSFYQLLLYDLTKLLQEVRTELRDEWSWQGWHYIPLPMCIIPVSVSFHFRYVFIECVECFQCQNYVRKTQYRLKTQRLCTYNLDIKTLSLVSLFDLRTTLSRSKGTLLLSAVLMYIQYS